ncbi:MAG: hypothetical protein ACYTGX_01440 [Planctomycetota bacterium]
MSLNPAELRAVVADPSQSHYRRRDALRDLLRHEDPNAVLAGMALLTTLLADPEKFLRREAAKVMADRAEAGDAVDLDALAARAPDEDEEVRRHVVRGLATSSDLAYRAALEALAEDRSYFIKRDAERALAKLSGVATPVEKPGLEPLAPLPRVGGGGRSERRAPSDAPDGEGILSGRRPPWERGESDRSGALGTLKRSPPLKPSPGLKPLPALKPMPKVKSSPELTPIPELEPAPEPPAPKRRTKRRRRRSKKHPAPSDAPTTPATPATTSPEKLRIGKQPAAKPSAAAQKILDTVRKRAKVGGAGAGAILDKVKDRAGVRRPSKGEEKLRIGKARDELKRHASTRQKVAAGRCAKCGWALRAGQKFCVFCGAAAKPAAEPRAERPADRRNSPKRAHTVGVPNDHGRSGHTVGVRDGHGSRRPQRRVQRHAEITPRQRRKGGFPGGAAGCLVAALVVIGIGVALVTSFVSTFNEIGRDRVALQEPVKPGTLVTLKLPNGQYISGILVRHRGNGYDVWIEEKEHTASYVVRDRDNVTEFGPSGASERDLEYFRSRLTKRRSRR